MRDLIIYRSLDFPPSTFIIWPVIQEDSIKIWYARLAISLGWPILGIGWVVAIRSILSSVLSKCSLNGDLIIEGAIILNRILGAYSFASDVNNPSKAALDVAVEAW